MVLKKLKWRIPILQKLLKLSKFSKTKKISSRWIKNASVWDLQPEQSMQETHLIQSTAELFPLLISLQPMLSLSLEYQPQLLTTLDVVTQQLWHCRET